MDRVSQVCVFFVIFYSCCPTNINDYVFFFFLYQLNFLCKRNINSFIIRYGQTSPRMENLNFTLITSSLVIFYYWPLVLMDFFMSPYKVGYFHQCFAGWNFTLQCINQHVTLLILFSARVDGSRIPSGRTHKWEVWCLQLRSDPVGTCDPATTLEWT